MELREEYYENRGMIHYLGHLGLSDPEKSVILLVHDGPGKAISSKAWKMASILNRIFIPVYYDMRLCGRTLMACKTAGIKYTSACADAFLEVLVDDLADIVEHVCDSYQVEQLVLCGHGFGSVVAMKYLERDVSRVRLYLGASQIVNPDLNEKARCEAMELIFNQKNQMKQVLFMSRLNQETAGTYDKALMKPLDYQRLKLMQQGIGMILPPTDRSEKKLVTGNPNGLTKEWENYCNGVKTFQKQIQGYQFDLLSCKLASSRRQPIPMYFINGGFDYENPYPLLREALQYWAPTSPMERPSKRGCAESKDADVQKLDDSQDIRRFVFGEERQHRLIVIPNLRAQAMFEDPIAFWSSVWKELPDGIKVSF